MACIGFHGKLLNFIKLYLSNRKKYVEYNGYKSVTFIAISGAPHGNNLAPLIFSIFVNHILDEIFSPSLLFADDIKFFRVISNLSDCLVLQEDLSTPSEWCTTNKLLHNVQKCKQMSISGIKYLINYT